jgi:hypothetical protein
MSAELVHARVVDHLKRLRRGNLADRLVATLSEAARIQPTYLDSKTIFTGRPRPTDLRVGRHDDGTRSRTPFQFLAA